MAEKPQAFKSSKKGYKAVKKGKYWKFTCACGSEMWDNRFKKKTAKSPDLRCKDENCPKGEDGFPHSVWLTKDEKKRLGMKTDYQKGGSTNSNSGDRYGNNVPPSMYAAWAKDMAIYLAQATGIKEHDELDALWRTCLKNTEQTLAWYQKEMAKKNTPEDQKVKDVDEDDSTDIDSENIDEPEDINEESLDDVDESSEESKEVEEDFSDLEDVEL